MPEDNKSKVYRDAWKALEEELKSGKASWGKVELQKRMQEILIERMEVYL